MGELELLNYIKSVIIPLDEQRKQELLELVKARFPYIADIVS